MLKIVIWLTSVATVATGQVRLTEEDAVAKALAGRASLRAAAERVRSADAMRTQAGLRPNPRLITLVENLRAWGTPSFDFSQDADVTLSSVHPFEQGGKRGKRVAVAAEAVRLAELERELETVRVASQVRQAYWRAATANKIRELLGDTSKTFSQIIEYDRARVREGTLAEVDLIRAELEAQRLGMSLVSATLEADRARIQLFREMGSTEFPECEFATPFDPPQEEAPPDVNRALERRIELRIARQQVEQARAAVRLAEANAVPDLNVGFGYKRTGGFDTLVGGVELSLPFWNRNQGAIASARFDVRAAEAALAAEEALVRAEIRATSLEFEMRRRQVLDLVPALRARADGAAKVALAAYRAGGSDLLRLIDAERTQIESQILYCRALGEYHLSRVALDTATGVQP